MFLQMCRFLAVVLLLCLAPSLVEATASRTFSEAVMETITKSQMDLTLKLMRTTDVTANQVLFSPFSITAALVLPYLGASKNSKPLLHRLLAGTSQEKEFYDYVREILTKVPKKDPYSYRLDTAIRLYVKKGIPIKREFQALTVKFGDLLGLEKVDFSRPPDTAMYINNFVRERLNRTIERIVELDYIVDKRPAFVIDAVHFSSAWNVPFDVALTKQEQFFYGGHKYGEEQYMHATAVFPYRSNAGVKVLVIPFLGEETKMIILLPEKEDGLKTFVQGLTSDALLQYLNTSQLETVEVALPKFKIRPDNAIQVWDKLPEISPEFSNVHDDGFTAITQKTLRLAHVVHKTIVEVNEWGANASPDLLLNKPDGKSVPDAQFIANHPFMFLVVGSDNVLILAGTYP